MDSWGDTGRLSKQLQKALVAPMWPSPRNVFAAFDTEAYEWTLSLTSGSDIVDLGARPWAIQLIICQGARRARHKNLGRVVADTGLESRAAVKRKFLSWSPTDIKTPTGVLSELCIQTHWCSLRTGVLAAAEIGEERQAIQERERQRWTTKTFGVLVEAKFPVATQALLAADPEQALSRAVGRKRASTLRARYRRWCKIRMWLQCVMQTWRTQKRRSNRGG